MAKDHEVKLREMNEAHPKILEDMIATHEQEVQAIKDEQDLLAKRLVNAK